MSQAKLKELYSKRIEQSQNGELGMQDRVVLIGLLFEVAQKFGVDLLDSEQSEEETDVESQINEGGLLTNVRIDQEMAGRYKDVLKAARFVFGTPEQPKSNLLIPGSSLTKEDIDMVRQFLHRSAPVGKRKDKKLWRKKLEKPRSERKPSQGEIRDWSSYGNWFDIGGPAEHIDLTIEAAPLILEFIKTNLKTDFPNEAFFTQTVAELQSISPEFMQAIAGLHDLGRLLSHLFVTNEKLADALSKRIGIRSDIRSAMPAEKVMLVEPSQNMFEELVNQGVPAIIMRIIDEFAKRAPTNKDEKPRLYNLSDYSDHMKRVQWADNYTGRAEVGRPTDRFFRENMPLHVANTNRYFKALNTWIHLLTGKTLQDLTDYLDERLAPKLAPIK